MLALSLSLVTAALTSLFLYLVSFGLTLHSWAVGLAVVTVGATFVAAALPAPANDGPKPDTRLLTSRPFLRPLPIAVAVAAACLAAGAVVLARTPLSSPSASGYTALWLTHKPHSAALTVGVRSEEHHRTRYRLRLVLAGHVSRRRFALAPGETWQRTLPPVPHAAASLYRAGHPGAYRSVRFIQPSRTGP